MTHLNTVVLMIGDRFFCGFGKRSRLKTAWSLAGATFFVESEHNGHIAKVEEVLINKSVSFTRKKVLLENT